MFIEELDFNINFRFLHKYRICLIANLAIWENFVEKYKIDFDFKNELHNSLE